METDQTAEGNQPFVAHVPVPSQKEVSLRTSLSYCYVLSNTMLKRTGIIIIIIVIVFVIVVVVVVVVIIIVIIIIIIYIIHTTDFQRCSSCTHVHLHSSHFSRTVP